MDEASGREPHLQVEVPKHIRDWVPSRFGVEITKPRREEAGHFGERVFLVISDQFSNKHIDSQASVIDEFTEVWVMGMVKAFEEFLAKRKVA